MTPTSSDLIIRRLEPQDDLSALTDLIHAAYAPHAAQGLRYWGTHQTVEDTAKRVQSGRAWVMLSGKQYVGTATLRPPQPDSPVALYRHPGVHSLAQFCICHSKKGAGLGRALHAHVLAAAQELGAQGIALDTARPAVALIRLYESWGYQVVGRCDWRPHTNYESVVMYKSLEVADAERAASQVPPAK
jgi:predicted N-acetyltransferase YhbS